MYYIKTRPGDVYDPAALERDLKELLSLNFFDKTACRVLTEAGVRGGVNVIFEVKELPIIRDLQFKGSSIIQESDILKEFREKRVGISKESVYDPVKARNAIRLLREMRASKGYPNAKITVQEDEVSATSIALTFNIDQGNRSRIVEIEFTGNEHFKTKDLRNAMLLTKETGLISRVKGMDILDLRKLEYDLQKNVRFYMFSKGYFQARIGEPQVEGLGYKRTGLLPIIDNFPIPLITSMDDTLKIVVPVTEGKVYRVGELKVHSIHVKQFLVLPDQRVPGLEKDLHQLVLAQVLDGHHDRQTSDKFRDHPKLVQVFGRHLLQQIILRLICLLRGNLRHEPDLPASDAPADRLIEPDERAAADEKNIGRVDLRVLLLGMLPPA